MRGVVTALLGLFGCGGGDAPVSAAEDPTPGSAGPRTEAPSAGSRSDVDLPTFVTSHAQGVAVLDVRTAAEFASGHVPGAVNTPVQEFLSADEVEGFDRSEPVYVICASGGRSSRAADMLAKHGWTAINVKGGTRGWASAGHPVE